MEMEYGDGGRRGKFVIVVGVLLALVAGGLSWYLITQAQQNAGQGTLKKVSVIVSTKDIPPRTPVQPADVELRELPLDAASQVGTLTKTDEVVGQVLAVPVLKGQPIYKNMILSAATTAGFAILGPEETVGPDSVPWRAVSITIADDRAVAGLLTQGQTVDIIATAEIKVPDDIAAQGQFYSDKSTKVIYQDIEILARAGQMYIIKMPLAQAEEITHMLAGGGATFSAVLRPDQDVRILDVTALGATTNRVIQKYGLPIPETYPASNGTIVQPQEQP